MDIRGFLMKVLHIGQNLTASIDGIGETFWLYDSGLSAKLFKKPITTLATAERFCN